MQSLPQAAGSDTGAGGAAAARYRPSAGDPTQVRLSVADLSDQILSMTDLQVYAKDRQGRYLLMNAAGASAIGLSPDAVVGRTDADLFPTEFARAMGEQDEIVMASGQTHTWEGPVATGDTALVCKSPLRASDGEIIGVIGLSRDISRRKRAEQALRRSAIENTRLYRESLDAIRFRDDFLAMASHELRTPLTPLRILLQEMHKSLRWDPDTWPAPRLVQMLELATRQVDRLSRLVDDLLVVSRITAGRLTLETERLDLASVVEEVLRRFSRELNAARCSLLVRLSACPGEWDRLRLEQIVTSLLTNAMKYGAGKPIEVEVLPQGATAALRITDHGIGIAAADTERIFERFERAASPSAYGGLGLGLYMTRQLVAAHRGEIRVESEPGSGSTFIVKLPGFASVAEQTTSVP